MKLPIPSRLRDHVPEIVETTVVPHRSTAMTVADGAWLGQTPAAWITPVMSPNVWALSMSAWTDGREDIPTTVVVLTSNRRE